MGLENVEKSVLADAQAEAARLLVAARAGLADRLAAEKREIEKRFAARRRRELARAQSEHNRELSRVRTEARLAVLKEKNRLIEEVFSRALVKLGELPGEEFLKLAAKWLEEVPTELVGRIVAAERERSYLTGAFLKKVNKNRKGQLELSDEAAPQGGGLVVRAEKFEFDFSWAGRLADRKGTLSPGVAAALFGRGNKGEA